MARLESAKRVRRGPRIAEPSILSVISKQTDAKQRTVNKIVASESGWGFGSLLVVESTSPHDELLRQAFQPFVQPLLAAAGIQLASANQQIDALALKLASVQAAIAEL